MSESETHRNAKEAIATYLRNGNALIIARKTGDISISMPAGGSVITEYPIRDGRADCVILTADGSIHFVIEITYEHPTGEYKRAGMEWADLDAREIEKFLDGAHGSTAQWRFADLRIAPTLLDPSSIQPGMITLEQCGAGSGKTYGTFLKIETLFDAGCRVFIFTSKTNAAIGVSKEESLIKMYDDRYGKSPANDDFKFIHIPESALAACDAAASPEDQKKAFRDAIRQAIRSSSRKNDSRYTMRTITHANGEKIVLLFATIDSILATVACQQNIGMVPPGRDMFQWNAEQLCTGATDALYLREWFHSWLKTEPNAETRQICARYFANPQMVHIFVDEAQDIEARYIASLGRVVKSGTSMTVLGDRLQSIYQLHQSSALTLGIDGLVATYPAIFDATRMQMNISNNVRRCKDARWCDVLGQIVPFAHHQLPHPTFAPGEKLDEASTRPLITIYPLADAGTTITAILEEEYRNGFTDPKQYMMLFSYIKNHKNRDELETRCADFWAAKRAQSKADLVQTHLSESFGPIRLSESEEKMRFLSIHASKGSGRDVVIWWDCDDDVVEQIYGSNSREIADGKLITDSLLHVALTRHKKRLILVPKSISPLVSRILDMRAHQPNAIECINGAFHPGRIQIKININQDSLYDHPDICSLIGDRIRIPPKENSPFARRDQDADMLYHLVRANALIGYVNLIAWDVGDGTGSSSAGTSGTNIGGTVVMIAKTPKGQLTISSGAGQSYSACNDAMHQLSRNIFRSIPRTLYLRSEALRAMMTKNRINKLHDLCITMNASATYGERIKPIKKVSDIILLQFLFDRMRFGHMTEQDAWRCFQQLTNASDEVDASARTLLMRLGEITEPIKAMCTDPLSTRTYSTPSGKAMTTIKISENESDTIHIKGNCIIVDRSSGPSILVVLVPTIDEINFYQVISAGIMRLYLLRRRSRGTDKRYVLRFLCFNADITNEQVRQQGIACANDAVIDEIVNDPRLPNCMLDIAAQKMASVCQFMRHRRELIKRTNIADLAQWISSEKDDVYRCLCCDIRGLYDKCLDHMRACTRIRGRPAHILRNILFGKQIRAAIPDYDRGSCIYRLINIMLEDTQCFATDEAAADLVFEAALIAMISAYRAEWSQAIL